MKRILAFLLGYSRVTFSSPRPERLLTAIHRMNLPVWSIKSTADDLSFFLLTSRVARLGSFRETLSLTERLSVEKRGLPALLYRYRKRFGFFAGLAIFAVTTLLANRFVWAVEVTGVTVEPEVVLGDLAKAGLSPGRLVSDLDSDRLAREFLLLHPEYAYAGIRLIGMRALVELRAAETVDKTNPFVGLSNLVSDGSGQVVRCESMAGEVLVKPGDLVTRGQLLVSGIRRRENGAFTPVRARGRVFAETEDVFETFVPFESGEVTFTGREEKRLSFSALGITLFSQGEKTSFASWDRQIFLEPVRFLGRDLPILCRTVVFSEKAEKMTAVQVDRASDLAYDRYILYKWELTGSDAEILTEESAFEEREDGVFLRVHLTLVRDLCREVPFTLVPPES